ncbi:hypothetical protein [Gimesia aquarii]|uniref:Uncharacterized protein n=1 Tax=Gimesia aquarii TaxID=2527964 RepID=A0A517WQK2_9PLAN|nr:hypothetical protein [Gimesia aquarii]QDU07535.1 hypothetical protein V202x_08920 [Gimesia aquarii]
MNDIFATKQRHYIPWPEYRKIEEEASHGTLIGQSGILLPKLNDRLKYLASAEDRDGFVYFGERKWLESCLVNGEITYSTWVLYQLNEVFQNGLLKDFEDTLGICWGGYTENVSQFWLPHELTSSLIQFDNIKLLIPGDESGPKPSRLCEAFEILHNLAYYLNNASVRYHETVFLDEIVIQDREKLWRIDLLNDYGSVGSVEFVGQEIEP